jgi:hypothetical protein
MPASDLTRAVVGQTRQGTYLQHPAFYTCPESMFPEMWFEPPLPSDLLKCRTYMIDVEEYYQALV